MTVWDTNRMMDWSTRAVIAAVVLAVLLVAAVPVAFVAGVILMLFGHIIVGLALFGAVTYLPFYLQVVKGQSPTRSGLYKRYELMVAYLLERRGMTVDQLLARPMDRRQVEAELLGATSL